MHSPHVHDFGTAFSLSLAAMFPIVNPVGHAPMFYVMTEDDSSAFRRALAVKCALYTVLILVISLLLGRLVLRFFGISLDDLRIAGGLLVARTAWGMLGNANRLTTPEHEAAVDKEDISLTPMATPILAGPGAMSLAIGLVSYGSTPMHYAGYIAGFAVLGGITWLSFRYADALVRFLSVNGMGALNRILGFFILGIGVSLMVTGAKNIFLPAH